MKQEVIDTIVNVSKNIKYEEYQLQRLETLDDLYERDYGLTLKANRDSEFGIILNSEESEQVIKYIRKLKSDKLDEWKSLLENL